MTKQQEIREGLFTICLHSDLRDCCGGHVGWIDGFMDEILNYLHSQGVVIYVGHPCRSYDDEILEPLIDEDKS